MFTIPDSEIAVAAFAHSSSPWYFVTMMVDANWLFSACAQTAGALVAILGGFIVSRLVSLSSQRNGLRSRLREVVRREELAKASHKSAQERLQRWKGEKFVADVLPELIDTQGGVALEELTRKYETWDMSEKELAPFFEEAVRVVRDAIAYFQAHPVLGNARDSFDEYAKVLGISLTKSEREVYERIYYDKRREAMSSMGQLQEPIFRLTGFRDPEMEQLRASEYGVLLRSCQEAARDISRLAAERRVIKEDLSRLGQPSGVGTGIAILAYLTVVGVILPLCLLPLDIHRNYVFLKWLVLALFFLGLSAFMAYLYFTFLWTTKQPNFLLRFVQRLSKFRRTRRRR